MDRVLVVYKKSSLDMIRVDKKKHRALKSKHPEIYRELEKNHSVHQRSLDHVIEVLEKAGRQVSVEYRSKLALASRADLVVAVGGDGTFLEAARHLGETPILSVNSDPERSVAHFSLCPADDFAKVFPQLGTKKYPLKKVYRLQVSVNNQKIDRPILNDFLLAHRNPASTTRLTVSTLRKKDFYKCSGIWVATGAGSTGAVKSAGGYNLGFFSRRWQYLVREPYGEAKNSPHKKILDSNAKMTIECGSIEARLYIDGPHRSHTIEMGDRITVSQNRFPVKIYYRSKRRK